MNADVEIWADIPGWEGLYQVSNQGRLKALAKTVNTWNGGRRMPERIVKPIIQHSGYAHVGLWRNQRCKQMRLHRLVAAAFCPNDAPEIKTQVNHLNENKLDNRAANLEWCTPGENTRYGGCIARRIYGRERAVLRLDADTGEVLARYKSQAEANAWAHAARADGRIGKCCRGAQKSAHGYRWAYAV